MIVAVRADASRVMGTGHVMRCLTLADSLTGLGARVFFICRQLPGNLIPFIRETRNYQVVALRGTTDRGARQLKDTENPYLEWLGVSIDRDAVETATILENSGTIDWVVADHYALDDSWHSTVRKKAGRIMAIDDLANRKLGCDLLLDQTHGRTKENYQGLLTRPCKMLMGAGYALLREEFRLNRRLSLKRRREQRCVNRMVVSMGGTDPHNLTERILKSIRAMNLKRRLRIDVVLGFSALTDPGLAAASELLDHDIRFFSKVDNMAALMMQSDLAIGAAGTTSWERCCLGLPSLMIMTAENQKDIAQSLHDAGAAINLGSHQGLSDQAIKEGLEDLLGDQAKLTRMSDACAQVCDGQGASRVADSFFG